MDEWKATCSLRSLDSIALDISLVTWSGNRHGEARFFFCMTSFVISFRLPRWCQWSRNSLPMQEAEETQVRSLAWEDTLKRGDMAIQLQYSCLEHPISRGACFSSGLQSTGSQWLDFESYFSCQIVPLNICCLPGRQLCRAESLKNSRMNLLSTFFFLHPNTWFWARCL